MRIRQVEKLLSYFWSLERSFLFRSNSFNDYSRFSSICFLTCWVILIIVSFSFLKRSVVGKLFGCCSVGNRTKYGMLLTLLSASSSYLSQSYLGVFVCWVPSTTPCVVRYPPCPVLLVNAWFTSLEVPLFFAIKLAQLFYRSHRIAEVT